MLPKHGTLTRSVPTRESQMERKSKPDKSSRTKSRSKLRRALSNMDSRPLLSPLYEVQYSINESVCRPVTAPSASFYFSPFDLSGPCIPKRVDEKKTKGSAARATKAYCAPSPARQVQGSLRPGTAPKGCAAKKHQVKKSPVVDLMCQSPLAPAKQKCLLRKVMSDDEIRTTNKSSLNFKKAAATCIQRHVRGYLSRGRTTRQEPLLEDVQHTYLRALEYQKVGNIDASINCYTRAIVQFNVLNRKSIFIFYFSP